MLSCANAPKRRDVRGRETDSCKRVDRTLEAMGLRILKTPVRAPQANAFRERVIGTIRRECLDFIIPMSEWHRSPDSSRVGRSLQPWPVTRELGPGIPEGSIVAPVVRESNGRSVPARCRVAATPILSGLHHEYRLERHAA